MADASPPSQSRCTKHHFRPQSRGGNHSSENYAAIPDRARHQPYHRLFTNLRPNEIVLLLFFSWETLRVAHHASRYGKDDLIAWGRLFGEDANRESAIALMREEFVRTQEDERLMMEALHVCKLAKRYGLPCVQQEHPAYKNRAFWSEKSSYFRLFGRLDPHEAILVVFLAWDTLCPHQEVKLSTTHKDRRGKPYKESFRKRMQVWDQLFGENASLRDVMQSVAGEFVDPQDADGQKLVSQSQHICRELEKVLPYTL